MNTGRKRSSKQLVIGAVSAAVALAVCPLFAQSYLLFLLTGVAIWSIVAMGINLIIGYAGQMALGHGAFYAIGAYTAGLLITKCNAPVWVALVAAGLAAMLAGIVFSFPALRVSGLYLALVTFGLLLIVQLTAQHWVSLTNGPFGVQLPPEKLTFFGLGKDLGVYYLSVALAILAFIGMSNLVRSDVGRSFIALRESEIATAAAGISVTAHKVAAFGISAFYVGIAGALYALSVTYISPSEFGVLLSIDTIFVAVIGGLGTLAGPVIGAVFFRLFPETIRALEQYQQLIFALILLVAVIYAPDGLVGIGRSLRQRFSPAGAGQTEAIADPEGPTKEVGP